MMSPRGKKRARLALIGALLVALGWLGRPTEIVEVSVPGDLLISKYLTAADHLDAYRSGVQPDHFRSVEQVAQFKSFFGQRLDVNQYEIVFQASFSGLEIYRSYQLRRPDSHEPSVTVVTAMHSTGLIGNLALIVVKPFHRLATPWIMRRMIARATAAA